MSDFRNHFELSRLVAVLDDDIKAQMEFLSIAPESYVRVQQYLVADLQSVRFNNLADMLSISDLWSPIRDNPPVVDLLLELTTGLQLHAEAMAKDGWRELSALVANAMGCFNNDNVQASDCALDNDDERDRYADPKATLRWVRSNPWLVTMFLLRRTSTVRKLISDLATNAARRPPAAPAAS